MAMKAMAILLSVVAIFAAVNLGSAAVAPAPAPAVDCSTLIGNMVDCLSYVSNGSTVQKPEGKCCSGLKKVLKTDADCICQAFKSSGQMGVALNVTKAAGLPHACHLSAPSINNCGLSVGAAPVMAPAGAPSTGTVTSTGNAPAPPPKSSGAPFAVSVGSCILGLVVASFTSF
ncbi:hypothetical protein NMG60_11021468 [Bertholletia excelsa]